jgi:hypothetical protein
MQTARITMPAFRSAPVGVETPLGQLVPIWAAVFTGIISAAATGYWVTFPAIMLLWAAWRYLHTEEGPPVFALAFTHHWLQIMLGLFYFPLLDRPVMRFGHEDPTQVCWLALLGAGALLLGLVAGLRLARPADPYYRNRRQYFFQESVAIALFLAFVATSSALSELAFEYPSILQLALAFGSVRLAFLYLLLRRYVAAGRWWAFVGIASIELMVGFTSYFASFREGFVVMFLALLERFDRKRTLHWALLAATGVGAIAAGLLWTAVKGKLRQEISVGAGTESRFSRLFRLVEMTGESMETFGDNFLLNADKIVDRQWPVHIPHLVLNRVPSALPHGDGSFIYGALLHVLQPRLLFPDKADLQSDSEKVRKYAGIWVAGAETNTTIAFGYFAESYIDFGVPVMYVPIFAFGLFAGVSYRMICRLLYHRELAVAVTTVVFWSSLYLFERSWDRILGIGLTLMIVITLTLVLAERLFGRIPKGA